MAKKNEIPKKRTSSLISMAAKLAFKEGKGLLQNQAEKRLSKMMSQAETVVQHVGQLKGAAMKAVQMITIESQDFLPPEVIKVLEKLQSQAPPIEDSVMKSLLKKEIGTELFDKLKELSEKPIAAASIGQVYEAKLENQPVVVKIQYPGISESVDSDLNVLKKIIKTLLFVSNKKINIDELFEEVTRILKLETNYKNEAKNLLKYAENFQNSKKYKVPKLFNEFTTNKVLVMSKEDGLEFTDWFNSNPSEKQKEELGYSLLNLYIKEFFENQFVQTDPNPANFLIDKEGTLVLLDFGATLKYTKKFKKTYKPQFYFGQRVR
jgi:aarF domain-containing kinase